MIDLRSFQKVVNFASNGEVSTFALFESRSIYTMCVCASRSLPSCLERQCVRHDAGGVARGFRGPHDGPVQDVGAATPRPAAERRADHRGDDVRGVRDLKGLCGLQPLRLRPLLFDGVRGEPQTKRIAFQRRLVALVFSARKEDED